MSTHLPITVVFPCFNEAGRLNVDAYLAFAETHPTVRLCFVNDGSTDATLKRLNAVAERLPGRVEIVSYAKNRGKSGAVRAGVLHVLATYREATDYIGFWDADLATPLDEVPRFIACFEHNPETYAVVGSRQRQAGTQLERSMIRQAIGQVVRVIIQRFVQLPIRDTQCGAKFFRGDLAEEIFREPFISRWLFDIELFRRMQLMAPETYLQQHVVEMPLKRWHDVAGSKLSIKDSVRILRELQRIKTHYSQAKA